MATPKTKIFTVSAENPEVLGVPTRLIRAQTVSQVESFLKDEAIKSALEGRRIEPATQDELIELIRAEVKVEDVAVG
jgi:hypothetical protein